MNVAQQLVADLESGLTADVPVRPAGSKVGALPCVSVRPDDADTFEVSRYMVHRFVVTAMVPRDETVAQYDHLVDLAADVLDTLYSAGYRIGTRLRHVSGDPEDVNYLGREFPVEVDGPVIC